jgi:predicted ATPase
LAAIVTQLSVAQPLVLLLEDWQWSDEGSREIVRQLGALVPGFPVLVVVTYRPEYSEDWSRLPHHTAIHLTPLAAEASAAIMQSVLQARSIPAELAELVHGRTGGNPFFIEEVCRTLVEKQSLTVEEGQVVLQSRIEDLHLLETIQAVIRARLDRLEPFVLELVRVASVIGREFGVFLLEHVLDDAERIGEAIEALQEAGLVRQARVVPDVAYRFQSALIQDVAHDTLLRHQQKALHGLVAEAMEARHGDQPEEYADALAKHFGQAGNWRKAMHYGDAAAERARSVSQFAESVAMLGRVVDWHQRLPAGEQDEASLVDLLLRQERLYETLGRRD